MHIYPNGKLPSNCFSCTFNVTFEKWKNYVVGSEHYTKKIIKMSNTKITYELKDHKTKVFFNGILLDRNSSDEAWNEWINYNPEDEKVLIKKSYFAKLPNSPKEKAESNNKAEVKEVVTEEKEAVKTEENSEEPKQTETTIKKTRRVSTKSSNKAK
ncbi:hypothetical protein D3C86_1681180 [compost metagenome]